MEGWIFDIQRFSLQDGPGIRTTVFLKGCPLRCQWCHNPESISIHPLLGHIETKCVYCGACQLICPSQAIVVVKEEKQWTINRERCNVCGACVTACFTGAMVISGKKVTVEEVMSEVLKDVTYYQQSGGGITLSGGEPMMQFDFTRDLLAASREKGIHTAIETSGAAPRRHFEAILPLTDLFLFDYKATGDQLHHQLTGVHQQVIMDNFNFLYHQGALIEVRCPMVPGINDTAEHLHAIAAMERNYPHLSQVRILPYHNTGNSKYERYGLHNPLPHLSTTTEEKKKEWESFFHREGCTKVLIE